MKTPKFTPAEAAQIEHGLKGITRQSDPTEHQEAILTLLHPAATALKGEQVLLLDLQELGFTATQYTLRHDLLALEKQQLVRLEKGAEWAAKGLTWPASPCDADPAVKTIQRLMHSAFGHTQRDPRSAEYRAGAKALLEARLGAAPLKNPHVAGTAQADAWWGGIEEGKAIYRFHLSQGVSA